MCQNCKNCQCKTRKINDGEELLNFIEEKIEEVTERNDGTMYNAHFFEMNGEVHVIETYSFEHDTLFRVSPEKPAIHMPIEERLAIEWHSILDVTADDVVEMLSNVILPQ